MNRLRWAFDIKDGGIRRKKGYREIMVRDGGKGCGLKLVEKVEKMRGKKRQKKEKKNA